MLKAKVLAVAGPAMGLVAGLVAIYAAMSALGYETASFGFLFGFPLLAGAIIMHFRPQGRFRSFFLAVFWLVLTIVLSLVATFLGGLEGAICIAMAAAPILLFAMAGGLIYLFYLRWRGAPGEALKVTILPLLLFLALDALPREPSVYRFSDEVIIAAPPALVFARIKSIPDIRADEVATRPSHYLGIPKPTRAVWTGAGRGALRHSHWGGDVHFLERITGYEPGRRIAWDFEFPEGWAAPGIEDPHVRVGGRYFNVLRGEYRLEDLGGATRLTLTSWTWDGSRFGPYAKLWHLFFFRDFHRAILDLVKARVEAGAGL